MQYSQKKIILILTHRSERKISFLINELRHSLPLLCNLMNSPIIYFRCHYSFGRCKFYALWLKSEKQIFTWFFLHGVMEMAWTKWNEMEFLGFSSIRVLWRNLSKLNMKLNGLIQEPLQYACIIQICLADSNEINNTLFNIFDIDLCDVSSSTSVNKHNCSE